MRTFYTLTDLKNNIITLLKARAVTAQRCEDSEYKNAVDFYVALSLSHKSVKLDDLNQVGLHASVTQSAVQSNWHFLHLSW